MLGSDGVAEKMKEGRKKILVPFASSGSPALIARPSLIKFFPGALKSNLIGFDLNRVKVRRGKVRTKIPCLLRRCDPPGKQLKSMIKELRSRSNDNFLLRLAVAVNTSEGENEPGKVNTATLS